MRTESWSITGSESLPIHGNTEWPVSGGPSGGNSGGRAVALVVHGWTGTKDRNITPVLSAHLASIDIISHRFNLAHCGVERDADAITRLDEFERDSLAFSVEDIRRVIDAIHDDTLPGRGLPLILAGHSRGAATILGVAGLAESENWPIKPAVAIALAATATFTRLTPEIRRQLDTCGFVTRAVKRATGGEVRMGRSWYAHHLEHPERDLFAERIAHVRCPVLLAHGNDDDSVSPDHSRNIEKMLKQNPGARVETVFIDDADHNFNALGIGLDRDNINNPQAQQLKRAITTFLDSTLS